MRKAGKIFYRDLRRLARNPVAMVVMAGVCLIPSLYAWFNIAANFDPYSNTGSIRIAVADCDKGTENELTGSLNAGEEITANLKENKDLGWVFVDEEEAKEGVRSGKYYAAIVIPENFSESLTSILDGELEQPEFIYYLNEKKNAIAPKITDTGAETIQTEVNTQFVAAASEAAAGIMDESLSGLGVRLGTMQENLTAQLQSVSDHLESYQSALSAFEKDAGDTGQLIGGTKELLDRTKNAASAGKSALEQGSSILEESRESIRSFSGNLEETLAQGENILAGVNNAAGADLGKVNEKVQSVNGKIQEMIESVRQIMERNQEVLDVLTRLDESIPGNPAAELIGTLQEENARHQELLDTLETGSAGIGSAADAAVNGLNGISQEVQAGQQKLRDSKTAFRQNVLPGLNTSLDSFSGISGELSGILGSISPSADQLSGILDGLDRSMTDASNALGKTGDALEQVQGQLKTAVADTAVLQNSQIYQQLMELTDLDAEEAADFMSSPVQLKTEKLYPVENYGTALAPFYTNLAIWVGGIVLIAILKLEVDRDKETGRVTAAQAYFGRWMLFVLLGLIQALIICLGDLYFLKIQCENPGAFIAAGLLASFVYVNLIYALSITWKHVGKALSVILVILQIPGSAGTYPIEMTPGFFQAIHPLLPFTYGINAMREAAAGIYGNHYLKDMLGLTAFLPLALLIGLGLRPFLLNLNCLFDRKLMETELMICEEEGMENTKISLPAAVRLLAGDPVYREKLADRTRRFERSYQKRIRIGLAAVLLLPILLLALMFGMNSKMVCLILWIASIIGAAAYLIWLEYMRASLEQKGILADMPQEELRAAVRNSGKEIDAGIGENTGEEVTQDEKHMGDI